MQLSKRLQMVADCVTKGNKTADVGCDHAYLSIYLIKNNIVPSIIAMDVNKGPLLHAEQNIIKHHAEGKIELRLSDGLAKLVPSEADTIVLAGMGGELMKSILKLGLSCVKAAKELVLQPQSEIYKIRRFLRDIGFNIIYENMCIDEEKYYVVIKAVNERLNKELNNEDTYDNVTAEEAYGGFLLKQKNNVLRTYLNKELLLNHSIQDKLNYNLSEKSLERLKEFKKEEKRLMEALSYY